MITQDGGLVQGRQSEVAGGANQVMSNKVDSVHVRGQNIRNDIEILKSKFIALLELCNVKVADTPLSDKPSSFCDIHQPLMTGVMPRTTQVTPQRSRQKQYDPLTYADILFEQLMTTFSSDSERSSAKKEDKAGMVTKAKHPQLYSRRKLVQVHLSPSSQGTSLSPFCQTPTSKHHFHTLQQVENQVNGQKKSADVMDVELRGVCSSSVSDTGTPKHTSNSAVIQSDNVSTPATYSKSVSLIQKAHFDSLSSQNGTLISTPELPVFETSDLLDIPYASLFDLLDYTDSFEDLHNSARSVVSEQDSCFSDSSNLQNPRSPVIHKISYFISPMKYSSFPSKDSPLRHLAFSPTTSVYAYAKTEMDVSGIEAMHRGHGFVFHEPQVVYSPSTSVSTLGYDSRDVNIRNSSRSHLGITSVDIKSEIESENSSVFPEKHIMVTQLAEVNMSQSVEKNNHLLSLSPAELSSPAGTQSSLLCSASDDVVQHYVNRKRGDLIKTSDVPSVSSDDLLCRDASWAYHVLADTPQSTISSMSTGRTHNNLHFRNTSWSYHMLPDTTQNNTANNSTHYIGHKVNGDRFITFRTKLPSSSSEVLKISDNGRSSKRRKGNDKTTLSVNSSQSNRTPRPVRQKLLFTSPSKFSHGDSTMMESDFTNTCTFASVSVSSRDHTVCSKRHGSLSLRSPLLQKENNNQSPIHVSKYQRKPLAELGNVRFRHYNVAGTSSDSLSPSGDYAKSRETSLYTFLPSRKEELLSRDAYYCDFTVDRQHKIDALNKRKVNTSSLHKDQYTLQDPSTNEIVTRTVEGAENTISDFAFQVPKPNLRVPRAAAHTHSRRPKSEIYTTSVNKYQDVSNGKSNMINRSTNKATLSKKCTPQNLLHSSKSKQDSSNSSNSHYSLGTRHSSESSKSHKSCTTHPIASSTMIIDPSSGYKDKIESFSTTYSISEEANSSVLDKSYFHSTCSRRNRELKTKVKQRRPLTCVDTDRTNHEAKTFEISAMVSRIDHIMSHSRHTSDKVIPRCMSHDMDTTQGFVDDWLDISGQSYTANRCGQKQTSRSSEKHLSTECSIRSNQDLLDSILTDSPKSVNSSGIFVPDNSYTIPNENLGFQNGKKSTSGVSSSSYSIKSSSRVDISSNQAQHSLMNAPAAIHQTRSTVELSGPENYRSKEGSKYTCTLATDANSNVNQRDSDVTTTNTVRSKPHKPVSIKSCLPERTPVFAVPSGVISGAPKITNKKSLVRKLRMFSSHFYKKAEKMNILANM